MTVVTLRPDGTVTSEGTLTGGATLHAVLNDNSDASYVTGTTFQVSEVTLGALSLPAGAIIKTFAIRLRTALTSAGSVGIQVSGNTFGLSGTPNITWTAPTTTTVASRSDATLTDTMADAEVIGFLKTSGAQTLRVYEAYFDVTYVALPAASADAPTGTVDTTNQPTVEWSNTLDSEGGAQTMFEVKVFTDAQYGAGGFDPDTSSATIESGITVDADTSWQIDEVLADDTYRAYVRVAQTVNGAPHWSDWDFTGFTIDVAAPDAPTLTASGDDANARIALAITDNAGSASSDWFEFQRSLDGGTTWADVRTIDDDGRLEAPYVVAVGEFQEETSGTSHAAVLPAPTGGILADDLLIGVSAFGVDSATGWPSGWTELKDSATAGTSARVSCAWKRATGGEAGTITITTGNSAWGAVRILCVRHAHTSTAPEISTGVGSTSANGANPDALNPSGWDTEPTLWIAAMGHYSDTAVTAGPSGYFDFGNTSFGEPVDAEGAGVATADRLAVVASENPGAFTHAAEDVHAFTVGVRPRNAALTVYDYESPNGFDTLYRARAVHDYSGVYAASDWAQDNTLWSSADWWLKHPNQPALNTSVRVRSFPSVTRTGRQGVTQALGASFPVIVSDTRSSKQGVVVLRSDTADDQDDLDALLDTVAGAAERGRPGLHQGPVA
jgi:hypothetical protein